MFSAARCGDAFFRFSSVYAGNDAAQIRLAIEPFRRIRFPRITMRSPSTIVYRMFIRDTSTFTDGQNQ